MNFFSNDIGLNGRGSCIKVNNAVDIRSGGSDIWGKKDEFMFYSTEISGNFTFVTKIELFEMSDLYAKAGLMAREAIDPQSSHVIFAAFPNNSKRNKNNGGYEFQYRPTEGGDSFGIYPSDFTCQPPMHPVCYPDAWLKLEREGDTFRCYSGVDGKDWKLYSETDVPLSGKLYVGLAVTAHSKKKLTLAKFSNIDIIIE